MAIGVKYKTVADWLEIGCLILDADDEAIAEGYPWKLVDAMRAKLEDKYTAFKEAATKAECSGSAYDTSIKEKRRLAKEGRDATTTLAVYIENAFLDKAASINHLLLLDLKFPTDDEDLKEHLKSVCSAIDKLDPVAYPLPAMFTDPVFAIRDDFERALPQVTDYFEDRRTAIQDRNIAMNDFKALLKPIRMWLWKMLPQGRRDTRLIGYGFTPYGTHHKKEEE